jgi:hypothetical protein
MVDLDGHAVTADNPVSANPELNKTLNTTWARERAARITAATMRFDPEVLQHEVVNMVEACASNAEECGIDPAGRPDWALAGQIAAELIQQGLRKGIIKRSKNGYLPAEGKPFPFAVAPLLMGHYGMEGKWALVEGGRAPAAQLETLTVRVAAAANAAEEGGAVLTFASRTEARQAFSGDVGSAANRFFRGATSKGRDFQAQELSGGGYRFQFFSPANNPGYGKLYVQEVDAQGRVVLEFKNTIGPEGLIETKWVHGGP